ncbi:MULTISPECIES: ABC transporter ATP-binding protein [Xanthocytophaga]|uniref:ABC transporter ATP-binding protein n=1 Tax=Xanthocytophaga agilis TaxID=3048010 RepID=A0AAE3QW96_9BACT|nr:MULTISPECIES: ABC transporter ATP-binding protein [Xanthocytophaga]MDJ1469426.1 ABC transporter ATP-binding protein [Xanthocytophaga flavus]MDJ1499211.1 ABC transporter ATP-binding protein [Xanthocytophaga agilis]
MNAIIVDNISKAYGNIQAVSNVSFEVREGELFGLIGPDGAGKTTLFKMLVTLLFPDQGRAVVNGKDIVKDFLQLRTQVGYMPGKFSLYQDLTIEENLDFFATVFGTSIQENYDLIKDIYVQIEPFKTRRAGKLSGGMKQKLALCCALIHKPEVLFLDEPTTGVDAVSRKEFWDMLKSLKQRGLTILVSTPYMDEAGLCDRIALMQGGKILAVDTPQDITKLFQRPLFAVKAAETFRLIQDLRNASFTHSCYAFGEYLHLALEHETTSRDIEAYLASHNHRQIDIKRIDPGIEDCFMDLISQTSVPAQS